MTRQLANLDDLSERDRALLTTEVIERWTDPLAASDLVEAAEIVRLERGRQRALQTIRQGVELTDLEFRLLRYLQRYARQTVTYQQIAHHLWGSTQHPITSAVLRMRDGYASPYIRHIWVLVAEIRRKLEIDPARPQHLATMKGAGYRWYNDPPSLDDGEDYARRTAEHEVLRAQVRYELGGDPDALPPPGYKPSGGQLGPAHRYANEVVEAAITEASSEPRT